MNWPSLSLCSSEDFVVLDWCFTTTKILTSNCLREKFNKILTTISDWISQLITIELFISKTYCNIIYLSFQKLQNCPPKKKIWFEMCDSSARSEVKLLQAVQNKCLWQVLDPAAILLRLTTPEMLYRLNYSNKNGVSQYYKSEPVADKKNVIKFHAIFTKQTKSFASIDSEFRNLLEQMQIEDALAVEITKRQNFRWNGWHNASDAEVTLMPKLISFYVSKKGTATYQFRWRGLRRVSALWPGMWPRIWTNCFRVIKKEKSVEVTLSKEKAAWTPSTHLFE